MFVINNLQHKVFVPVWTVASFLGRCLVSLRWVVHLNDGVHFLHISCICCCCFKLTFSHNYNGMHLNKHLSAGQER